MANFNLRFSSCTLAGDECIVQNDLAITPAQMELMTVQGRAIAQQQCEPFSSYPRLPIEDGLPLAYSRGCDQNIAWEATQVARRKVKSVQFSES